MSSGGVQTFTTNGTFIVPEGITKIWVTACGGGQGDSSNESYSKGGTGGSGADYILRKAYNVTPGQSIKITIGKGGNQNLNIGVVGGSTIIGDLVTIVGGGVSANNRGGIGGLGGENGERTISSGGKHGDNASSDKGGGGGGASLGRGGNGNGYYTVSNVSPGPGGGGGGSGYEYHYGQKGGDGIVIIEW